ncbi:MAG: hypothetical protein PSV17_08185 [Methylotenera sp.]|nr:hypothetical protein [Methylotenera sp.]MDI1309399.1 hypothetical protein [Methylotenera sp.]
MLKANNHGGSGDIYALLITFQEGIYKYVLLPLYIASIGSWR